MGARSASVIVFRIVYSSIYTILFIVLILLLAVTPGDHIYQTLSNDKVGNIFVVGGTLVVTALIAFFIYASRLYTNRTALLAIPKPYLPIEEGELGKKIFKMTVKNRQRSALIAWESRPRDLRTGTLDDNEFHEKEALASPADQSKTKRKPQKKQDILSINAAAPPWGDIFHPGWSSPISKDVPDLQFDIVIAELPNLIEAKAVSLAPPDPAFNFMSPEQATIQAPPDPQVVALLQRPLHMGLREYVTYLDSMKLIDPQDLTGPFISRYEYARFSTNPLLEDEFLKLMTAFSELLAGIQQPDWQAIGYAAAAASSSGSKPASSAASQASVLHHRPSDLQSMSSSSSLRSSQSVIHH